MEKRKNTINTLEDVKIWRELKKDELDLEKLKFYAEKEELKSKVGIEIGKAVFFEGLFLLGEKVITNILTSFLKPKKKKSKKSDEAEGETE